MLVLRFAGRSAMDDFLAEVPFEPVDENDCDEGSYYAYWDNELGAERGLLNCWQTDDGTAWIAWSIYSTNIVMVATGTDLAMYEWWKEATFPDHA